MPDVVVVGGGIIGAACALELADAGASVELIERDELAAGASGRNAGLWARPTDPALQDMAETSLARYRELTEAAPVPFDLDPAPIGTVLVPLEGKESASAADIEAYRALGVKVEDLDAGDLRSVEPALSPELERGWLVDDGHRLDPAALTVSLALLAADAGARVRHHVMVRGLLAPGGERVRGVATDDGPVAADSVVIAAGPWSLGLLEPIGIHLPITPVRGWIVRVAPGADLLAHLVGEAGWRTSLERSSATVPVTTGELAGGHRQGEIGLLLGPHRRSGVQVGASRQSAVTPEPEDAGIPMRLAALATRLVPGLAGAPVVGSSWGLRPMTPDERPIVGAVRDGLVLATGHGSEGVILGGGTGVLVASIVTGTAPSFAARPFDPARFG